MMSNLNKPNYSNREMKYVVGLPPRCFLGLARFASKCCECLGLLILQYLWSPGQNLTLNAAAGLAELTFEKKKKPYDYKFPWIYILSPPSWGNTIQLLVTTELKRQQLWMMHVSAKLYLCDVNT